MLNTLRNTFFIGMFFFVVFIFHFSPEQGSVACAESHKSQQMGNLIDPQSQKSATSNLNPSYRSDGFLSSFHNNGNITMCMTKQTEDGGYLSIGNTDNSGAGSTDILLMKCNAQGEFEWAKTIGSEATEGGCGFLHTSDGGYLLTGFSYAYGDVHGMLVVKTDASFTVQWAKIETGIFTYNGVAAFELAKGGYIVFGTSYFSSNAQYHTIIFKYDASGTMVWGKWNYSINGYYWIHDVKQLADGFIIVGETYGDGFQNILTIKFDFSGEVVWAKRTAFVNHDTRGYSIIATSDGGYFVTGTTGIPNTFISYCVMIKYDSLFQPLWAHFIGQRCLHSGIAVAETSENTYSVVGGYGGNGLYLESIVYTVTASGEVLGAHYLDYFDDAGTVTLSKTNDNGCIILGQYPLEYENLGFYLHKTTAEGMIENCPYIQPYSFRVTNEEALNYDISITMAAAPDTETAPSLTVSETSLFTSMICGPNVVFTETPVSSPTNTPLPTATHTPTTTATPSVVPTMTIIPSPTPNLTPSVSLYMPAHYFTSGDACSLTAWVQNPGTEPLTNVNLFVFLDIGIGEYWFAPRWLHYPPDIDYVYFPLIPPGEHETTIIPEFQWPEHAGAMDTLKFFSALTDQQVTMLISAINEWDFGYGD